jgi:hypothetical protein
MVNVAATHGCSDKSHQIIPRTLRLVLKLYEFGLLVYKLSMSFIETLHSPYRYSDCQE